MKPLCLIFVVVVLVGGIGVVESHNDHHDSLRHLASNTPKCGTARPGTSDRYAQKWALGLYQSQPETSTEAGAKIVVPVCFHVLQKTDGSSVNLTNAQLQKQLDALNVGYDAASCCNTTDATISSWCRAGDCSIDTGINFAMAKVDGNGGGVSGDQTVPKVSSNGACVTRTTNNVWAAGNDETGMKSALRKGDAKVLNLYFVIFTDDTLGYARYPWDYESAPILDGVVVDAQTIPGGAIAEYNQGDTAVHEVGHWLGLLHTFEGGCSESDGIADTPPEKDPYYGCDSPLTQDTCPGDSFTDPVFNFMDYSDDACLYEFTAGQKKVMQACWEIYRLGRQPDRPILTLKQGVRSDPLYLVPGERQVYQLDLRAVLDNIVCKTSASEGDADLYLNIDQEPNFSKADCCVSQNAGSKESCARKVTLFYGPRLRFCRLTRTCELQKIRCSNPTATTLYAGIVTYGDFSLQGLTILCE